MAQCMVVYLAEASLREGYTIYIIMEIETVDLACHI